MANPAARALVSLKSPNYRLWFSGQLVSLCGTHMQVVALAWLVLKLSHNSGGVLGVVTGLQTLPTLLLGTSAGVLIDRIDTRRLLLFTETVLAASAGLLALLTFSGHVAIWNVSILVAIGGAANALDLPGRLAFVHELVGVEGIANAIGLNSMMVNGGRIVGPAVGGLVLVKFGTAWCFLLNSLTFVLVIGCLLAMDPRRFHEAPVVERAPRQTREGLAYARTDRAVRSNLLFTAAVGMFAFNFPVVLPLLAKVTFHGDASLYTTLAVVNALGGLAAALYMAGRPHTTPPQLVQIGAVYVVSLLLTAVAPTTVLMYAPLVVLGGAYVGFIVGSNSMLQLSARPTMRGRVLGLRTVALVGGASLGSPIVGWVSEHLGPRWSLVVCAVSMAAASVWYSGATRDMRTERAASPSEAGQAIAPG